MSAVSAYELRSYKAIDKPPLVMVTAYDAPSASIASEAGVDLILVGDSLGTVVLGYPDTLSVTLEDMAHHVAAVSRAHPEPLVVSDMPWLTYHLSEAETVRNAAALVKAGAGAVKLEGGRRRVGAIRALLDVDIPVMGHLGLTPQSLRALGRFRVQGRSEEAAKLLREDAELLAQEGCFAIVLEAVPDDVAAAVTESVDVPTIGIGAGSGCDGQVLVMHDLLGIETRISPRFVRRYAELRASAIDAIRDYCTDVRSRDFPGPGESYGEAGDGPRSSRS